MNEDSKIFPVELKTEKSYRTTIEFSERDTVRPRENEDTLAKCTKGDEIRFGDPLRESSELVLYKGSTVTNTIVTTNVK